LPPLKTQAAHADVIRHTKTGAPKYAIFHIVMQKDYLKTEEMTMVRK